MKQSKKDLIKRIAVILALCLIVFILAMKSGFNFFSIGGRQSEDGDVFRYIGILMSKGYVPYRDIFDHKGPVLYFIEYIATFLGNVRGIWPFEIAFLGASVCISYAFAKRFNNRLLSILIVLLTFSRWDVCGYGNCTEEFSLLFQLISVYFFADFYLTPSSWISETVTSQISETGETNHVSGHMIGNKWFDLRVFLVGICFACVFFMKANFCAVWIVFCLAIFIHCIRNKYWESLRRFIISFLLGAVIVTVPVLAYLFANDAFEDFLFDYFTFNGLYVSSVFRVNIETVVDSFVTFTNTFVCVLAFVIMGFKIARKDKTLELDIVYTIFMAATVVLITMSGQSYEKMEIAFISFLIYPFSILFNMLKESDKKWGALSLVVAGYLVIAVVYPSWSTQVSDAASIINTYVNDPDSKGMYSNRIVNYIKDNTEVTDKITVFGNSCAYYIYGEREPATKYIYFPHPDIDPEIADDYFEELRNNPPKLVAKLQTYKDDLAWADDELYEFLDEYGYTLGYSGDFDVYIRE